MARRRVTYVKPDHLVAAQLAAKKTAGKAGRKPRKEGAEPKKEKKARNAKSLPDATLRRAVIVIGPKRVGPRALEEIRTAVEEVVTAVVADATRSAACEGRKTIKGRDTRRALAARGITLV
jgi:histone H3/H4